VQVAVPVRGPPDRRAPGIDNTFSTRIGAMLATIA
jgi:hypothetical protein